MVLKSLQGVW